VRWSPCWFKLIVFLKKKPLDSNFWFNLKEHEMKASGISNFDEKLLNFYFQQLTQTICPISKSVTKQLRFATLWQPFVKRRVGWGNKHMFEAFDTPGGPPAKQLISLSVLEGPLNSFSRQTFCCRPLPLSVPHFCTCLSLFLFFFIRCIFITIPFSLLVAAIKIEQL